MGQPGTKLIYQRNGSLMAINTDVDVQSKDQVGTCGVLKFLLQSGIPFIRRYGLLLPQCSGMSTRTDQRKSLLSHKPRQFGPQNAHLFTGRRDIWQDIRDQFYHRLMLFWFDLLTEDRIPLFHDGLNAWTQIASAAIHHLKLLFNPNGKTCFHNPAPSHYSYAKEQMHKLFQNWRATTPPIRFSLRLSMNSSGKETEDHQLSQSKST